MYDDETQKGKSIRTRDGRIHFDFIISNPAYQGDGENEKFFLRESRKLSDVVMMAIPANSENVYDEKFEKIDKILNCEDFFAKRNGNRSRDRAVFLYHKNEEGDEINSLPPILSDIQQKVWSTDPKSLIHIVSSHGNYRFTETLREEYPEVKLKFVDADVFARFPQIFQKNRPCDGYDSILMLGILNTKHVYRWVRRDFINAPENLTKYKVMIPASNRSETVEDTLSQFEIGAPNVGHTETFLSVGSFDNIREAENCRNYLKTQFCQAMHRISQETTENTRDTWQYVPWEDFGEDSDINWNVPIWQIDTQLFEKYGLTDEEIAFIKSPVPSIS